MASGPSNFNTNSGSSSSTNDYVANSSLTATATEFVPNATNQSKFSRRTRYPKNSAQGFKANSRDRKNEDPSKPDNGDYESASSGRHFGKSSYKSRQVHPSSFEGNSLNYGANNSFKSNDISNGGLPSRPSVRFSGKNSNTPKRHQNRSQRDRLGQSSSDHYQDTNQDEGAVGGEDSKSLYSREYSSGNSKYRDRNGNREQSSYRNMSQSYYTDKPKFKESNDQSMSKKKEFLRNFERDPEKQRDGSRYWERGTSKHSNRDAGSHSEDVHVPKSSDRPASFYPERGQDHYQDKFNPYGQNIRYRDRFPNRYRDDRTFDRNFGDSDQDYRSNDRGYGPRSRYQHEFMKDDQSYHKGNSSFQRERGSSHNFNTHETFGSENKKFQSKETNMQDRSYYGSSRREGDHPGRNQNVQRSINHRDGDDISQRDRLTEQLVRGTLECLVCCDRVRQQDSVWSCSSCFHVLHLRCVVKWAKSSKAETGWRCPACQNVTETIPSQYRCFCSKILDPQWNRQDTPHTCGEVCGKTRESQRLLCIHRCTLLCHPGPCPPCLAQVVRTCGCGKSSQSVKCGLDKPLLCESTCGKPLNCDAHLCEVKCHSGPCEPCQQKIEQVCFCKKEKREVDCVLENQGILEFSCSQICALNLACGNHRCEDVCHPAECKPCQLTPDLITHCPCGQTELSSDLQDKRKSCLDKIPTCEKICGKKLPCGQPSKPHGCKSKCHSGLCPVCPLSTMVRCRCGHMDRELPCDQLTSKADDARCEKKCTKKRSCAKHKCNQLCCIEVDHPCPLPCNHTLSCGLHRCENLCHRGHCRPCWRTSFDELFCECGTEVIYPPVPCGTKPPTCSRPCPRQHDCEHPALHTCHSEPNCPPCTVLTQKYCYGNHELRKTIPCHQNDFSCGLPCNKELPCGHHKCIQLCHKGDCVRSGVVCTQPCGVLRHSCQHPCSAPCHDGPCPDTPCKESVRVTCECGHRSAMRPCAENTREYQRIATSLLASKMADVQLGHSIDIGDIMGNASTRKLYWKSLECNDECKVIERNRRMAIGLQIRNPDISQKLTPRYSDFMRGWAKKDAVFCQHVHDKLTELVKLAKESKQKSRSHSFEIMNREKRQFVHEYCEHFGCESVAYDQEPKRNVVATAEKTKAWLPSVGLLELVQRDAGQRRVPGPMLNSVKKPLNRNMDTLASKWVTKPAMNGASSSSSVTTASPNSAVLTHASHSYANPASDEVGVGSNISSSYIDHFNS